MPHVVDVRLLGDSNTGLATKGTKVMLFESKQKARDHGISKFEKNKFVLWWEAITVAEAKRRGYKILKTHAKRFNNTKRTQPS